MQLTPILEVVKEILKPAGLKGLHVDEIARQAVAGHKNAGLSLEDFSRKIQAALASHLKLKTTKPSFARVEGKKGVFRKGWYRVKQERTVPVASLVQAPIVSTSFLGKGGEMAVISELLFWGYNASAMLVDSGIDLVASKDGKYFHIQVKTASDNNGRFSYTIKKSSFDQHDKSDMFYIFVLRHQSSNEFVILPSNYIRALIAGGKITNGQTLSVTIVVDDKRRKYMLNGSTDVGIYLNNMNHLC
jgi:hypothetical protein